MRIAVRGLAGILTVRLSVRSSTSTLGEGIPLLACKRPVTWGVELWKTRWRRGGLATLEAGEKGTLEAKAVLLCSAFPRQSSIYESRYLQNKLKSQLQYSNL